MRTAAAFLAIAGALLASSCRQPSPLRDEAWRGPAIAYSGYRDGQSPVARVFPSEAEIAEDLRLLAPHFEWLRLYDCTPHAERELAVIRRERAPFKVLLGGWLAAEVDNLGCPWGGVHGAAHLARNVAENEGKGTGRLGGCPVPLLWGIVGPESAIGRYHGAPSGLSGPARFQGVHRRADGPGWRTNPSARLSSSACRRPALSPTQSVTNV